MTRAFFTTIALTAVIVSATVVARCGGSSSSPTSPTSTPTLPTTPSAASGWKYAPEGLRLSDAGGPAAIQVGGTTYLFTNNGKQANVFQTTDGVSFAPAPFDFHLGIANSFAVLPDGRYRVYVFNSGTTELLSYVSPDLRQWTKEDGVRLNLVRTAVPRVTKMPTGGYRVYYSGRSSQGFGEIDSAFSNDGLTFTLETGGRLLGQIEFGWGDPVVAALPSGGFVMVATKIPSIGGPFSSLWLATSPDGLSWTLDTTAFYTDATGSPVDSTLVPVGTSLRVYHGLFVGTSAVNPIGFGNILSGLLTR